MPGDAGYTSRRATTACIVDVDAAGESELGGQLRAGTTSGSGVHRLVSRPCTTSRRSTSSGFSYVEVLVAVVVVGITVIATMVGLRTTVISGRVGTERSQLLVWANEATEALHRDPYVACSAASPSGIMTSSEAATMRTAYQATLDAVVAPDGMAGGSLVVDPPQMLSIDPNSYTERWDDRQCDPEFDVAALRVTATSPEGTTVEVEVIVDG